MLVGGIETLIGVEGSLERANNVSDLRQLPIPILGSRGGLQAPEKRSKFRDYTGL